MMSTFYNWDAGLYKLINHGNSNAFFDFLMPIITDKYTWIPLYVLILIFFIYKFRKYAFIPIIGLALSVGASDYITSGIIKPNVNRVRPCNVEELKANILAPCRNSPSFPSSHAANHFAIALFLSFFIAKKWNWVNWLFFIWAFAIAYSRVYVGVHYPFDVTMGALIGGLLSLIFAKASIHLIKSRKQ